ncbi:MAG: DUF1957 domain-containing protein [Armatimonadota bacterium]|nr:DUF1957 domain-containing protein [Armatimonadota bacterium]
MSTDPIGSFALVLHSHLPYVLLHGRSPHGTDWLTEAASETYLPLLDALYGLVDSGCSPKITIGITPVLAEQLADPTFVYEFQTYLQAKIDAASVDEEAFTAQELPRQAELAAWWREHYQKTLGRFRRRYGKSIIGAFKELQDAGHIEIMTSGATHGYSPLLCQDTSIQAQVKQGVRTYKRHFGKDPRGYWLPECAYRPRYVWSYPAYPPGSEPIPYLRKGVEEFLGENGLKYFIVESHLLRGGQAGGVYADRFAALKNLWSQFQDQYLIEDSEKTQYTPYWVNTQGKAAEPVAVFARDPETGGQVWSAASGYPGDEWYLEFHKKHVPGNHRYWRISGANVDLGDKLDYEPQKAAERTRAHAEHFVWMVKDTLRKHLERCGTPGVICAPYDTELFGHWWFEGVDWLTEAIRLMSADPEIQLTTCGDYLEANPPNQVVSLPEGSWGEGGFHWIWFNQQTYWSWELVYDAELCMRRLAQEYGKRDDTARVLAQAARELLLLQSSDWQFNISSNTSVDYGHARIKEHYGSFKRLEAMVGDVASGRTVTEEDWDFLAYCEERDPLFPDIDPNWYAGLEVPAE